MSKGFRMATWIDAEAPESPHSAPFCHLVDGQPLVLSIEGAALAVHDLHMAMLGYVAKEHVPTILSRIQSGQIVLAKINGRCHCFMRPILVWTDGQIEVEDKAANGTRIKQPERV